MVGVCGGGMVMGTRPLIPRLPFSPVLPLPLPFAFLPNDLPHDAVGTSLLLPPLSPVLLSASPIDEWFSRGECALVLFPWFNWVLSAVLFAPFPSWAHSACGVANAPSVPSCDTLVAWLQLASGLVPASGKELLGQGGWGEEESHASPLALQR